VGHTGETRWGARLYCLRRLVNKAFTNHAVDALRPRIEQITGGLLEDLAAVGRADVIESFAFPPPTRVGS
jgi:cytochrome P450